MASAGEVTNGDADDAGTGIEVDESVGSNATCTTRPAWDAADRKPVDAERRRRRHRPKRHHATVAEAGPRTARV